MRLFYARFDWYPWPWLFKLTDLTALPIWPNKPTKTNCLPNRLVFFAFQSSAHCMARHWILIWALASVSYQVISISIDKIYFKVCFAFLSGFAFLAPTKLINWHSRSDDLLSDLMIWFKIWWPAIQNLLVGRISSLWDCCPPTPPMSRKHKIMCLFRILGGAFY